MEERILKEIEARIALDHNAPAVDDSEQEGEAGRVCGGKRQAMTWFGEFT